MDNGKSCAILIPAYEPDEKLLILLENLTAAGYTRIFVVDDGSGSSFAPIFEKVSGYPQVVLLHHVANRGKGAALKTAFSHIYRKYPDVKVVITADSDGQHRVEDIAKVQETAAADPGKLWLGVRQFDGKVPLRSKIGNRLTAFLMRIFLGMDIADTQTGLRAIPREFIPPLMQISYDRYEFELEMLLCARRYGFVIGAVPIKTLYIDNNASSHFHPLRDSFKIYIVLFRYILVSLLTALVDYLIYVPVLWIALRYLAVPAATAAAVASGRIAGAAVQYSLVRKVVFHSDSPMYKTLPQYLLLVTLSGLASYLVLHSIESGANWNFYIAKPAAELLIYLANFLIQKEFIFKRREDRQ